MQQTDGAAPAWLFSFVDLAFLMLIAMTQLAPDPGAKIPNLGEMIVPKVGAAASTEMSGSAAEVWQLRVHPPEDEASPYELVRIVDGGAPPEGDRIQAEALRVQLADLKAGRGLKPMLAPHEDSRSQDMLEAAALLEELGHEVDDSYPVALDEPDLGEATSAAVAASVAKELEVMARNTGVPVDESDVEPATWAMAERGRALSVPDYLRTIDTLHAYGRRLRSWWSEIPGDPGHDILITPTMAEPARVINRC